MKGKTIILAILAIGILAGVLIYTLVINKSHPDYADLPPEYELPASDLYEEFVSDPKASSEKYNGKIVQINGKLSVFESNDSLKIAVFVFNEGMFGDEGIRCTFLNSDIDLSTSVDEEIALKGYCTGYNETDVIIEKCTQIK